MIKIDLWRKSAALCLTAGIAAGFISNEIPGSNQERVTYEADSIAIFPNPERGFAPAFEPPHPAVKTWNFCEQDPKRYTDTQWVQPLNENTLRSHRVQGTTLIMVRYHLAAFRYKPISPAFLQQLENDFDTVRRAGIKIVLRFVYNWWGGGPDAPADRIVSHIEQLRPLLQKHVDVIALMDLGFIGCFGEIHSSSFGNLRSDPGFKSLNNHSKAIIDKLFDALPPERMIAVRHPAYKFQYFNGPGTMDHENTPIAPLTAAEAFNGSKKSRWGALEDCLVCSEYNCGTWATPRNKPGEIRNFLTQDNRYVVQSGESGLTMGCDTIPGDPDGDGYTDAMRASCERVLKTMAMLRWSVLNASFERRTLQQWRNNGCYDDITRKLGYRFRLVDSYFPASVTSGSTMECTLQLVNDGWASCYNPRAVEIILRHTYTKAIITLPVDVRIQANDPRFWLPGSIHRVHVPTVNIPKLPAGQYEVLLNLPDPKPTLHNRPEYAIRLANVGTWEDATGYNRLLRYITVR